MNVFDAARSLNLPLGSYIVIGSGTLAAYGIREAQDLDVVVTNEWYDKFKGKGWQEGVGMGGIRKLTQGEFEIFTTLEHGDYNPDVAVILAHADVIEGIPFLPLPELKKFKTALGREKDFRDIALIDAYLSTR